MTNHDRILQISIYDLLVKLNSNNSCIVVNIDNLSRTEALQRCSKYNTCEECIQAFLNEEAN